MESATSDAKGGEPMKLCQKEPSASENEALTVLAKAILSVQCDDCFSALIGKTQKEQAVLEAQFRNRLCKALSKAMPTYSWTPEWKREGLAGKDSVDLYGAPLPNCAGLPVLIELDKPRADQVAKKAVSRLAIMGEKQFVYVTVCYVGTEHMNVTECEKYFGYIGALCKRLKVEYLAFGITD